MFGQSRHRAQKPPQERDARRGRAQTAVSDALRNTDNSGGGPSNRPPSNPNRPPQGSPNSGSSGGGGVGWFSRILLLLLVAFIAYNLLTSYLGATSTPTISLSYSDLIAQIDDNNVVSITIQDKVATGQLTQVISGEDPNGNAVKSDQFQSYLPFNDDTFLQQQLYQHNVPTIGKPPASDSILITILINVVPVVVIVLILLWLMRRASANQQGIFNFGRSRARLILEDRPTTTFADVAGVDEAKQELEEVVEFLKTPQKFQRLGGKIPRGVLLVGPPGTGKTLLARAVAGEAGVPFFSISGSEFVEVLVGVGASRVRDLFDQAKRAAPSIIFIDEIDAVGRQRGTSLTTNDEREQTLNQLLVEMDGFDTHQAVVVIAATNRPDGLDQALLRPGRFDRRVVVERPDWKGRLAILQIHVRGVPLSSDVDLQQLARATTGMVGADLANLVNEAALLAARRNLDRVNMQCFNDALDRIQLGAERPLVLSDEDRRVVAYHEGGHALVGLLTPHSDPVTKVTIVPRGQALGVTQYTPLDDRYNYSRDYLIGRIMSALGGRGAEEVALGSITTGAENDLQQVTLIARNMVTRWGMSQRVGLLSFSDRPNPFGPNADFAQREYSEATAQVVDEETRDIVQSAYQQVRLLLQAHRPTLDRIAEELRRHETLDAKQLNQILIETGISLADVAPTPHAEVTTHDHRSDGSGGGTQAGA
jgi:cell division protease FtsH